MPCPVATFYLHETSFDKVITKEKRGTNFWPTVYMHRNVVRLLFKEGYAQRRVRRRRGITKRSIGKHCAGIKLTAYR